MLRHMRIALLLACSLLTACASHPRNNAEAGTTFIVVRHAEKADASRDPDLSTSGHARAQALAERLDGRSLAAVYATEYKRTGQTIAPSANARGIAITPYPAGEDAQALAARLRSAHTQGSVLIAGHSNTVPAIIAALCACAVAEMPDHEYDRLSLIHVDADGQARLQVERYGPPTPAP